MFKITFDTLNAESSDMARLVRLKHLCAAYCQGDVAGSLTFVCDQAGRDMISQTWNVITGQRLAAQDFKPIQTNSMFPNWENSDIAFLAGR